MVVATVPPRIPVLEANDLPYEEDWAVIEALGIEPDGGSEDGGFEHELQYDRYGSLMLAPAAFD
jgi:hypothetical protein